MRQAELARRLDEKQTRISRYFNDREPDHAMTRRINEAFGLPSGWLLAKAGYLTMPRTYEEWLEIDPAYSDDGKKMLLELSKTLRHTNQQREGDLLAIVSTAAAHSAQRASS